MVGSDETAGVKPTVCLTMIVRDAADFITETLTCALPFIDTWSIVDTGSVDSTAEVVQRFFDEHGVPGELHHRVWRGFGPNRTEALELSRGRADYAFMLDADDLIEGALPIDRLTADCHSVRFGPHHVYWRAAFFRLDRRWEYRGVVHEYAVCLDEGSVTSRLEGDYHLVFRSLGNRSKDPKKFEHDAELLLADWEREPDPRTAFYLGQSYRDAGQIERAAEWYERRGGMRGWVEETFVALVELARCYERLERDPSDIVQAYTKAWEYRPERAEALFHLARFHAEHKRYAEAYKVICRADATPFPEHDILFVPADVYRWRITDLRSMMAYRLGFHDESVELCDQLLASPHLPHEQRDRILSNRRFSLEHVREQRHPHRPELAEQITRHLNNPQHEPRLTLTITTCKRRELFERTIDSFLHCCLDRLDIDRWICIDDGSTPEDLQAMRDRYPFFEYITKPASQRGHAHSMNRLLQEVTTPYWLHLEDDWDFITIGHFLQQATHVLDNNPTLIQTVLNRHYAEALDQRLVGGALERTPDGFTYLRHVHLPGGSDEFKKLLADNPGCTTAAYWPGYSLMPSLLRTDAVRAVGAYNPKAGFFEREFADRALHLGWQTAFLDTVTCVTTGPLRTDRSATRAPNAYELNGMDQFQQFERTTIGVTTSFADPSELAQRWRRQFPRGGNWRGVELVEAGPGVPEPDYWLVVNTPQEGFDPLPERTIVVQMEPSDGSSQWGAWSSPDTRSFAQVRTHDRFPNTIEWHLGMSYDELWSTRLDKSKDLSAVVSSKWLSPGHHLRLDLIHHLERQGIPIDVFGYDNAEGFDGYRGALPDADKRNGLMPYRYTIAVENCIEKNYFTEKVVDAILCECLPFYWGCAELDAYIDPDACIRLPVEDPVAAQQVIETAIANNEWQRRFPAILRAKQRLIDRLQLAPTLSRVVGGLQLMEQLDVRVINLDRRPDRLGAFRSRLLAATGERFASRCDRFAAIDGSELELTDHIARTFRGSELPLRRNQTACAISHLALWWEVANGDGRPMLILEDDATFVADFNSRLVEVCADLAEPQSPIDVVMLGLLYWSGATVPTAPCQQVQPVNLDGVMGGTFGYVITQRGARRLWEIVQRDGIPTGIDTFLLAQRGAVGVGQAVPALVDAPVARPGGAVVDSDIQYDVARL